MSSCYRGRKQGSELNIWTNRKKCVHHFVEPKDTVWWCSGSSHCGSSDGKEQRILGDQDEENGWLFSGVLFKGSRKTCLGKG